MGWGDVRYCFAMAILVIIIIIIIVIGKIKETNLNCVFMYNLILGML
jgi:hypothetical protein